MVLARWSQLAILLPLFTSLSAIWAQVPTQFAGKLDGALHVDPTGLSFATFNPISQTDAQTLGVATEPGDKIFSGEFALPKNGDIRYRAVVVRQPDGMDVLYVDKNRNGPFEPEERIIFRRHVPSLDDRLATWAEFKVALPARGPFRTCPMDVWLIKEGVRSPAGPGQLAVPYTTQPFVEGYVQLPKRTLELRLEYDFDMQGIALTTGIEWVDINGDGKFDPTPGSGETLRAHGSAPIFEVQNLTLQLQSVDLNHGRFVLGLAPRSADRRIHLSIGSVLPDFEFTDFTGAHHQLSDLKGRFVLLDFWATWCVPCMEDLPILKKTYADFHAEGFEILGMDGEEVLDKPE